MKVKIEGFYYLKDALKYGTISAAAEHNYMAQSNFSREISKLEDALGVKLLDRNKKGIEPTQAYRKIEKKIEGMLELLEDIETICKEEANIEKKNAHVILGINWAINNMFVRQIMGCIDCYEEENVFDFSVKRSGNKELIDMLLQEEIDYAVVIDWYNDISSFDKSKNLRFEKLFDDDIVVCIGQKSKYWDKKEITVDEVLNITQLTFTEDLKYEELGLYQILGGIPSKLRYANDLHTAINIVCDTNHCFMSIESFFRNNHYLQNDEIRLLALKDFTKKIPIYFVYRKAKNKNEKDQKFILDVKRKFLMT